LISAAETRGEVKQWRLASDCPEQSSAQIESGSQIPVQTTQAGAAARRKCGHYHDFRFGSSASFNYATDHRRGTVILRVTIENNTVNTGIAVGGVPGIDTQRMQSEVMVPDGGTTVMGGVLSDQESTTRQRTPGAASIPIIGNMFKRKQVSNNSTEILSSSRRTSIGLITLAIQPRRCRPRARARPPFRNPFRSAIHRRIRRRRLSCSNRKKSAGSPSIPAGH